MERHSDTVAFLWILQNFQNTLHTEHTGIYGQRNPIFWHILRSAKKVTEHKLISCEYELNIFSFVNIKADFNFAIHETKSLVMILVEAFHITSLMGVKKILMLEFVCSMNINQLLIKTWLKSGSHLSKKIVLFAPMKAYFILS